MHLIRGYVVIRSDAINSEKILNILRRKNITVWDVQKKDKGTRFKIELNNSTECYTYIFGMDTDGSSYVLFPYMKPGETVSKHSPYCGITGYRLFPKGQSLTADSIGNRDYMAIVISKDELDYRRLNEAINNSRQGTYSGKVNEALREIQITGVRYNNTAEGKLYFKVDANSNKAVAAIVALNKK